MCQIEIYDNHTQVTFTIDTLIGCDSGTPESPSVPRVPRDNLRLLPWFIYDCYLVNDLILFTLEFFVGNDIVLFVNCNIFYIIFLYSYILLHTLQSSVWCHMWSMSVMDTMTWAIYVYIITYWIVNYWDRRKNGSNLGIKNILDFYWSYLWFHFSLALHQALPVRVAAYHKSLT